MPGKVPQRSSGAPKSGAGASLGKKITSKGKIKPAPRTSSSGNNETQESGSPQGQSKEYKRYNSALNKYQNQDPSLAFMKEENFKNQGLNEDGSQMSITERNIAKSSLSGESLASRINATAGRSADNDSLFGSGRSRLPGDTAGDGPVSGTLPRFVRRYALQRSKLLRGVIPDGQTQNNPLAGTTFTNRFGQSAGGASAVNSTLSGTNANQAPNFEGFAASYLRENAPHLSRKFETDSRFKENYLNDVEKLYNSLDVRTLGEAPVEERRARLVSQAGNATARDRMQVANGFMTLLANQGRTVDEVAQSGLTVFMADSIVSQGERVAGYFSTDNHMVLSRNPGFATFNATAVHELTHVLDNLDGNLDGRLRGLQGNWSDLREQAIARINRNNGNFDGLESGFVNYSTTNDLEFLAVMNQLYQSDTADLQRHFPQIFSALDRMFRVA
jgi:hypothetical protein